MGPFLEAAEGEVVWKDVDEDTFSRFSQFAYAGDYDCEQPEIIQVLRPDSIQRPVQRLRSGRPLDKRDPSSGNKWQREAKKKLAGFREESDELRHRKMDRRNMKSCEDYTKVFLCHARLYTLADMYDVQSLKRLSSHKLVEIIYRFKMFPGRIGDITTLISYVFKNTTLSDKLRQILGLYGLNFVRTMQGTHDFRELLYDVPEFSTEMFHALLEFI